MKRKTAACTLHASSSVGAARRRSFIYGIAVRRRIRKESMGGRAMVRPSYRSSAHRVFYTVILSVCGIPVPDHALATFCCGSKHETPGASLPKEVNDSRRLGSTSCKRSAQARHASRPRMTSWQIPRCRIPDVITTRSLCNHHSPQTLPGE